jgi:hypothetical protein
MTPPKPTPQSIPPDYSADDEPYTPDPDRRLTFKSANNLVIDRDLEEGQHLEVLASGRVSGLQKSGRKTVWWFEVLDAQIVEPERRT